MNFPTGILRNEQLQKPTLVIAHNKTLGLQGCALNLGISQQSLSRWQKELRETGDIENRGSGNYASDDAKEIARLYA